MSPSSGKVQLKVWLPADIKTAWDLLLLDPLVGRAGKGSWGQLVERLLRAELASRRGRTVQPAKEIADA